MQDEKSRRANFSSSWGHQCSQWRCFSEYKQRDSSPLPGPQRALTPRTSFLLCVAVCASASADFLKSPAVHGRFDGEQDGGMNGL